jgi:CPA1 family monovalent cation:H+ antiporter
VGLLVAWLIIRAARSTKDALAEALLTLAGPYVAWLTAERLHVSAVLACVAGGIYLQQHISTAVSPASRLQTRTVWDLAVFLLNSMIFLLLGAQIRMLLDLVPRGALGSILLNGAVITLVAIGVRLVWVPLVTVCRRLSAETRRTEPARAGKHFSRVMDEHAWRGVLATALALPRVIATGAPFPYRTEIILVAMCVIVLTLVMQDFHHPHRPRISL